LDEYQALGARIALFPTIAATVALQASWEVLNDFKQRGTAALDDWGSRQTPWGRAGRQDLVNHQLVRKLEEEYLPEDLQRDYEHTWGHGTSYRST
jgi:hypothetical protein